MATNAPASAPAPTTADIDQPFPTLKALKAHQANVSKNPLLEAYEQLWTNTYFTPLTIFMGDPAVIQSLGVTVSPQSMRNVQQVPRVFFTGRRKGAGHYLSRPPGATRDFDPYHECQIPKTMQFCQTYAMMHALDRLVWTEDRTFTKFYEYTLQALNFIKETIANRPSTYSFFWINRAIDEDEAAHGGFKLRLSSNNATAKAQMLQKVEECIRHYHACQNIIAIEIDDYDLSSAMRRTFPVNSRPPPA